MTTRKRLLLASTLLAGLMAAAPALAQAPATPEEEEAAAAAAAAQEATEVEAVVVTGSRIRRSEFTSAAPIQVITSEQSTLEGLVDTGQLLQSSSLAAGSLQLNGLLATNYVIPGGSGVSSISLRGLGAQRTLVLLNGRRAGPAGIQGQVGAFDLNVIPQSAIERVEILKDGASSIYGSDAVAGVVNIITKTNTDGFSVDLYGNVPTHGGAETFRLNGTWGATFDRGYVSVSADYYQQEPLRLRDREFTVCAENYSFDPDTGERNDLIDPLTGEYKCINNIHNVILIGGERYQPYNGEFPRPIASDASGIPGSGNIYATALGPDWIRIQRGAPAVCAADRDAVLPGGLACDDFAATSAIAHNDDPRVGRTTIVPGTKRATFAAFGGYDLSANVEAYGELLLNRRETDADSTRVFFPQIAYPFSPTPLDGSGYPAVTVIQPVALINSDREAKVDYVRVVAGLSGDFGAGLLDGWQWDIHYQGSRSEGEYTADQILDDAAWAAGDIGASYRRNTGQTSFGCADAPVTPISNRTCVDVDWFGADQMLGHFTPEERAFLFTRDTGRTTYTQQVLEATVAGDLFEMPAGPVGAAVGFQYRKDDLNDTPGEHALAQNLWQSSTAGITKGSDDYRELFGEIEVPLARGMVNVDDLTLTLSGRWTDTKSYGGNGTYKIGLNWRINPSWRLRATQGTSFRAPALYEQFLGDLTGFQPQTVVDPCINYAQSANPLILQNCAADGLPFNFAGGGASATVSQGGGDNLEPETSEALSLGVIWTPDFIDLSIALDYFEIEVSDEVAQLGPAAIPFLCYTSPNFPNDPICDLFTRDRNATNVADLNRILHINDDYINIANQINRGLDLTARYRHELPWGDLTVNSQFTWQLEDVIERFPGSFTNFNGGLTRPDFVGNTEIRFDRGDWTAFWAIDLVGKTSNTEQLNGVDETNTATFGRRYWKQYGEFTAFHSLSVRKRWDDLTLIVGVQNLFDDEPPAVSATVPRFSGVMPQTTQHDFLGRRVFFNVSKRF